MSPELWPQFLKASMISGAESVALGAGETMQMFVALVGSAVAVMVGTNSAARNCVNIMVDLVKLEDEEKSCEQNFINISC